MLVRALAVWVVLLVIAMASGMARGNWLEPRVGEPKAHVIGTLGVVLLFAIVIWWLIPWIAPDLRPGDLWIVGAFWLVLTVVFEFGFGRYVMKHPWSRLLHDYDLFEGRIWILVLLTTLLWPVAAGALRRG